MSKARRTEGVHIPSGFFWYIDAEQGFSALTQLCTLRDEPQTIKIHIRAAYDCNKLFVCADEAIIRDVTLETGQCQCPGWFRNRSRL